MKRVSQLSESISKRLFGKITELRGIPSVVPVEGGIAYENDHFVCNLELNPLFEITNYTLMAKSEGLETPFLDYALRKSLKKPFYSLIGIEYREVESFYRDENITPSHDEALFDAKNFDQSLYRIVSETILHLFEQETRLSDSKNLVEKIQYLSNFLEFLMGIIPMEGHVELYEVTKTEVILNEFQCSQAVFIEKILKIMLNKRFPYENRVKIVAQ